MGRMTDVRSVAANAKVDNILTGKIEELVTTPSLISVAAIASAVAMRMTIVAAGVVLMDDQELSGANRFPNLPDDVIAQFALTGPTDRVVISLRNTTAGAITVNTAVDTQGM